MTMKVYTVVTGGSELLRPPENPGEEVTGFISLMYQQLTHEQSAYDTISSDVSKKVNEQLK